MGRTRAVCRSSQYWRSPRTPSRKARRGNQPPSPARRARNPACLRPGMSCPSGQVAGRHGAAGRRPGQASEGLTSTPDRGWPGRTVRALRVRRMAAGPRVRPVQVPMRGCVSRTRPQTGAASADQADERPAANQGHLPAGRAGMTGHGWQTALRWPVNAGCRSGDITRAACRHPACALARWASFQKACRHAGRQYRPFGRRGRNGLPHWRHLRGGYLPAGTAVPCSPSA